MGLQVFANVTMQTVARSAIKMSDNIRTTSATEAFYVQPECCIGCGVPQSVAPDLVGWTNEHHPQCYWIKQPETAAELNQAIKLFRMQELGCHRYSGNDPAILQTLPVEDCDHFRPDLKLNRNLHFTSFGGAPTFVLSVSGKRNLFGRMWRRLLRK